MVRHAIGVTWINVILEQTVTKSNIAYQIPIDHIAAYYAIFSACMMDHKSEGRLGEMP